MKQNTWDEPNPDRQEAPHLVTVLTVASGSLLHKSNLNGHMDNYVLVISEDNTHLTTWNHWAGFVWELDRIRRVTGT